MLIVYDDFDTVSPNKWKEIFSFQSNWHPFELDMCRSLKKTKKTQQNNNQTPQNQTNNFLNKEY